MERDVKEIVRQMTLEEKAGMCSGKDFWHLKSVERLGIPEVMVSDGPHGLRKQAENGDHLGINESIKAVCFPAHARRHALLTGTCWRRWVLLLAQNARRKMFRYCLVRR